jgi:hypothetical protein
LIDFLGNFVRSAKEGLPIYRIGGGAGFVWAGNFDQKGRGTLRFAAVDASAFTLPPSEPQPTSQLQPIPQPEPTTQPQETSQSALQSEPKPQAQEISEQQLTAEPQPTAQLQSAPQPQPTSETIRTKNTVEASRSELGQKIEALQGELVVANATIAELEKTKAAAEAAQTQADEARLAADTARSKAEQARAIETAEFRTIIAELEADRAAVAAHAKGNRWENALYGSIGGLLVVLAASTIGVFARRRNAHGSGTSPIEASTQPENSNAQIEPYAPSPAIAIAEDVFGRELEEEVAALNATQDEAVAQDSPAGEARPDAPQNEAHGAEKSFAEAEASEKAQEQRLRSYAHGGPGETASDSEP